MKVSPCKGCSEREMGCHGKCSAYKGWKEECEEEKARIEAERRKYNDFVAHNANLAETVKKQRGNRR